MHRFHHRGPPRRARRACVILAWAVLGLGSGLAGCTSAGSLAGTDKLGDPLLGPTPPPNTTAPQQTGTATGGLPPVAPGAGATTTAGLAAQTPPGLAIDSWARKADGPAAAGSAQPVPATPVSQPKVEPIPKDNSATASPPPAIQPTGNWSTASQPPAAAPAYTEAQLEQMLKAHGVQAHKQTPEGTGIRLDCAVPNPANPSSIQYYTTTAADYPTAVLAILREIDPQR